MDWTMVDELNSYFDALKKFFECKISIKKEHPGFVVLGEFDEIKGLLIDGEDVEVLETLIKGWSAGLMMESRGIKPEFEVSYKERHLMQKKKWALAVFSVSGNLIEIQIYD